MRRLGADVRAEIADNLAEVESDAAVEGGAAVVVADARVHTARDIRCRQTQTLCGSNGDRDIFGLMPPEKTRRQAGVSSNIARRSADQAGSRLFANDGQVRGWPDDHRLATFNNAGLLAGNRFDRVSEKLLMIETDACDDRDILLDDIRCIETAAKADFQDRQLHTIAKVEERHSCDDLEVGRRVEQILRRGDCGLYSFEDFL